jgi:hypothetical protein
MNIRKPKDKKEWAIAVIAGVIALLVAQQIYRSMATPKSVREIQKGTEELRKQLE